MDTNETAAPGSVVVALDESSQSRRALAWAAGYARSAGLGLHAVHVVRYDFGAPESWSPGLRGVMHTVSAPALDGTRAAVQGLFEAEHPRSSWTLTHLDGPAGPTIVRFADLAGLLVVGTREHTGVERILVGSVSHYCMSHATCPVVAVPPPPSRASTSTTAHHERTTV